MDPISLAVRSLSLSILPGINYAINSILALLGASSVHELRLASAGLHLLFSHLVLSFRQPHFRQAFFLGLLFVTVLALNLRITRLKA